MLKEPELITCSNPKCGRKIRELIVVSDLSTRTINRYYGCPHCFFEMDVISANSMRKVKMRVHAEEEEMKRKGKKNGRRIKLDVNAKDDEDNTGESEPGPPMHPPLEKIPDVIPAEPQKKQEELPTRPAEKEEKGLSGCPQHFGYLTSRPQKVPIPQECLACPKVVDCTLKTKDS